MQLSLSVAGISIADCIDLANSKPKMLYTWRVSN